MALDIRNLKNKVTANDDITDVAESVVTGIAGVTSAAAGLKAYIPALICTLIAAFVSFFFKQEIRPHVRSIPIFLNQYFLYKLFLLLLVHFSLQ